jgi:ATP-dependent DNA helicase RecG
MIDKGENVNVEFKKELSSEEFLETVVAFANTSGGIIFLGVDDNCRIKGFKEDVKAKIIDLIADHCDPPIGVQIDSGVLIQGTPITLVKVPEGTNKPYTLKDRGIFVRRGSSDRQIKRTELDDIYDKKRSFSLYR